MAEIRKTQPNLLPESRYVIRVRAINPFNVPSEWSDSLVFTTLTDKTIPSPPTNLVASWDVTTLLVSWSAPTTNTDGSPLVDLKGYEVKLTSSSIEKIYNITDTSFTYTGAQNIADFGTLQPLISIVVRAVDYSGHFSDPATLNGANSIPPDPTQAPILVPSFDGIMITLVPPPGLTDYKSFLLEYGVPDPETNVFDGTTFIALAEISETDTFLHVVDSTVEYYYRFKVKDLFNQVSANYSPVSNTNSPAREIAMFSQAGALDVTTLDDVAVWEVEIGGSIDELVGNLSVAGANDTVLDVYVNGGTIGSITIPTGEIRGTGEVAPPVEVIPLDRIQVICTTAGAGAMSPSVKIRMKG